MNIEFENNFFEIFAIFVAIIIPFIIYYLEKKKKKLIYKVIWDYNKIDLNNDNDIQNFEIRYNGQRIEELSICDLVFLNVGDEITPEDFIKEIKIVLKNCKKILEVKIIKSYPFNLKEDLKDNIIFKKNEISIKPLLLNKSDLFLLSIIYEGKNSEIFITSRIKGLKKIINDPNFINPIINSNFFIYLFSPIIPLIINVFIGKFEINETMYNNKNVLINILLIFTSTLSLISILSLVNYYFSKKKYI